MNAPLAPEDGASSREPGPESGAADPPTDAEVQPDASAPPPADDPAHPSAEAEAFAPEAPPEPLPARETPPLRASSSEPAPEDEPSESSWTSRLWLAAGLLIVGSVAGVLLLRAFGGGEQQRDAIAAAAQTAASSSALLFESDDPDAVATFLAEELGWRVQPPAVNDRRLEGAGLTELAPGVEAPFLRYVGGDAPLTVIVMDYAFLDRHESVVGFAPGVYTRLADPTVYDVHEVGGENVVLWRDRDDIFAAVTTSEPTALVEALTER